MPEVKLTKPWRFYEDGCRQIDFKAGLVQMSEEAAKFAKACGVLDKDQSKGPVGETKKKSE